MLAVAFISWWLLVILPAIVLFARRGRAFTRTVLLTLILCLLTQSIYPVAACRGHSSSPPFNPLQFAPSLWLDASVAGSCCTDTAGTIPCVNSGDLVAFWRDLSGNGNHLTQALSGNRPTYQLAVQNGKPVVRFNGSSQWLSNVSFNPFGSPFTVVGAGSVTATNVNQAMLGGHGANSLSVAFTNAGFMGTFRNVVAAFSSSVAYGTPWARYFWQGVGGTGSLTVNCAANNGAFTASSPTGISADTGVDLGADHAGSEDWWHGDMGSVLVFPSQLSASQLTQLYNYLVAEGY